MVEEAEMVEEGEAEAEFNVVSVAALAIEEKDVDTFLLYLLYLLIIGVICNVSFAIIYSGNSYFKSVGCIISFTLILNTFFHIPDNVIV